ncbi:profilin [Nonomuraea dietziae]|uniref:profilin n=1 Tax=Nonomuraea dietziae TaxID=65515 RepID=UPI0033E0D5DD
MRTRFPRFARTVRMLASVLAGSFLAGAIAAPAHTAPVPHTTTASLEHATAAPHAVTRRAPDWQSLVNGMVTSGTFTQAAIVTRDGAQILATAGGLALSASEAQTLATGFASPSPVEAPGLIIARYKHFVLRADGTAIYATRTGAHVIAKPTTRTIVLGIFGDNTTWNNANISIDRTVATIRSQGS